MADQHPSPRTEDGRSRPACGVPAWALVDQARCAVDNSKPMSGMPDVGFDLSAICRA